MAIIYLTDDFQRLTIYGMDMNAQLSMQILAKYCEMLNAQLADILHRLRVAETALQSSPHLQEAYNKAVKDTQRTMLPGLPRQLQALQQTIDKIR